MFEWWKTLSKGVRAVAATLTGLVTIFGVLWVVYSHFQTAEAAETQHEDIYTVIAQNQKAQLERGKNERIDRQSAEIKRLEYKLLSEDLTPSQQEYIRGQVTSANATIQCIREETC